VLRKTVTLVMVVFSNWLAVTLYWNVGGLTSGGVDPRRLPEPSESCPLALSLALYSSEKGASRASNFFSKSVAAP
jgi:hypothetical protein